MVEAPSLIIPSPKVNPREYNRWVYGLEELSSHTGIRPESIAAATIFAAKRGGYRSAADVLTIQRIWLHSVSTGVKDIQRVISADLRKLRGCY